MFSLIYVVITDDPTVLLTVDFRTLMLKIKHARMIYGMCEVCISQRVAIFTYVTHTWCLHNISGMILSFHGSDCNKKHTQFKFMPTQCLIFSLV